jgi:PiT family inorganic phosphate transporter
MGVGTSDRIKAVRWGIARSIVTAWILTIPSTAIIAGASYLLLHLVGA